LREAHGQGIVRSDISNMQLEAELPFLESL